MHRGFLWLSICDHKPSGPKQDTFILSHSLEAGGSGDSFVGVKGRCEQAGSFHLTERLCPHRVQTLKAPASPRLQAASFQPLLPSPHGLVP